MGATDNLRRAAEADRQREQVQGLQARTQTAARTQRDSLPAQGSALVINAVAAGNGSICDVAILSNGQPTGIHAANARTHGAPVKPGDVVLFTRKGDGSLELHAGGGSGGGPNIDISGNLYVGGFSKWDGSVRVVFSGS